MVVAAVRTLEPSLLAKFAFGLAQGFNAFYHRYPILNEPDASLKLTRAAVAAYVRRQLQASLALLGASVPARM
jgi:arginyl-tRNA synthetase